MNIYLYIIINKKAVSCLLLPSCNFISLFDRYYIVDYLFYEITTYIRIYFSNVIFLQSRTIYFNLFLAVIFFKFGFLKNYTFLNYLKYEFFVSLQLTL